MRANSIIVAVLLAASVCQTISARQPHSGYRGFIEWSNDMRSDEYSDWWFTGDPASTHRETNYYSGLTTSHGYQINPIWFVGAGLGLEHCRNINNYIAPLFIHGRADLKFGNFTPFADLRLGANMAEGIGIYLSPSVGYRFNWGRKMGINLSLGYTLTGYKVQYYEGYYTSPEDYEFSYVGKRSLRRSYFSFRLGFDF